jgi:hypothetical protein
LVSVVCFFVEREVGAVLRGAGEEGTVFGCHTTFPHGSRRQPIPASYTTFELNAFTHPPADPDLEGTTVARLPFYTTTNSATAYYRPIVFQPHLRPLPSSRSFGGFPQTQGKTNGQLVTNSYNA